MQHPEKKVALRQGEKMRPAGRKARQAAAPKLKFVLVTEDAADRLSLGQGYALAAVTLFFIAL